ncbi:uncharacterized protein NEMAJ01_1510 [Nematocida major]|uniref:uncharacterized protein n=1 Tax=Nematocida major TaxID=1912982 RepID=UPI0020081DC9|nr:uncharacterized protein NEMAJ01_1510 [Nematocida major]KAH9386614.1 hypothetical protein NEMAJ01_1510 [Nematocida major]
MVYQRLSLNELMKPKYACGSAGLFFIFLGLLLFDTHLMRAGNVVVFMGVLMAIKSLDHIKCILLFFLGFIVSFKLITLGLLIEMVALVMWGMAKISTMATLPAKMLKRFFVK